MHIYIYMYTHIYICICGTFSFVGIYRNKCKGPLFSLTSQLEVVRWMPFWLGLAGFPAFGACRLFLAFMVVFYLHCACSGGRCLHLSCFRYIRWLTQQTCPLCDAAGMSVVSHSRHVRCVTQQISLLCQTGRHVCCVT